MHTHTHIHILSLSHHIFTHLCPGVGSKTMGDEWIGHQDAFDDLLAQLNAHQQHDREGSGMWNFCCWIVRLCCNLIVNVT